MRICYYFQNTFPMQCSGRFFYVSTASLTYAKATTVCTMSGGRLMKLDTKTKLECVEQNVLTAGNQKSDLWFGLLRLGHNMNDFIWTDGTLFNGDCKGNWGRFSLDRTRVHSEVSISWSMIKQRNFSVRGVTPVPPADRLRTAIFMNAGSNLAWDEQSSSNQKGYICEATWFGVGITWILKGNLFPQSLRTVYWLWYFC